MNVLAISRRWFLIDHRSIVTVSFLIFSISCSKFKFKNAILRLCENAAAAVVVVVVSPISFVVFAAAVSTAAVSAGAVFTAAVSTTATVAVVATTVATTVSLTYTSGTLQNVAAVVAVANETICLFIFWKEEKSQNICCHRLRFC